MKIDLNEKIEFPEGVEFEISGHVLNVKSGDKENSKEFNLKNIEMKKEDNVLVMESKKATKNELKMFNTIKAHINNMIEGVKDGFTYKLEIAFVHFPMSVKIDEGKNEIIISNFLGEKKDRHCEIVKGTEVKIDGKIIEVASHNKELAGQMAANLEKATTVRKKDIRKFQDGIYIIEKPGRII